VPNDVSASTSLEFLVCPACRGEGILDHPTLTVCTKCQDEHQQHSVFAVFGRTVLRWNKQIDLLHILEDETQQSIRRLINLLLVVFGVVAFLMRIWQIVLLWDTWTWESFFLHRGLEDIIFWFSLVTDCYAYYRVKRRQADVLLLPHASPSSTATTALRFEDIHSAKDQQTIDVSRYYTREAFVAVEDAWRLAYRLNDQQVFPLHLLLALLEKRDVQVMLGRMTIPVRTLVERVNHALGRLQHRSPGLPLMYSKEFQELLFLAYEEAIRLRRDQVGVTELFVVIAKTHHWAEEILFDLGADAQKLENVAQWIHFSQFFSGEWARTRSRAMRKPKHSMNRAMTARPTDLLDRMSRDLTLAAREGALFPMINRLKEMDEMMRVLEKQTGNVLIVGDSGVGKTQLAHGLAYRMAIEDVPETLKDRRLVSLDLGAVVAGADAPGALEQRMMGVIEEVAAAGNVILFIDDIAGLMGARSMGGGAMDISSILGRALSEGLVRVVGASTTSDYMRYLQNNEAFVRRFQRVNIGELDDNGAIQVAEGHAANIENRHRIVFSYDAIEAAVKLSRKYIHDRYLPSKALDLMEEAAVLVRGFGKKIPIVRKEDVEAVLMEKTNIRVSQASGAERETLLHLEERIHERIVGQDEAVNAVSQSLRRARTELRDEKRPIINLLFLGPTGVGKTELAKTVSDVYFGSETRMIRLDMSEYQTQDSLSRLIGAPPGRGSEAQEAGQLTEAVRQSPFSLVLLDELEKAHPDILTVFLQVMDDGRLTDGAGRTVDFTNAMIIATSNAGTQTIQDGIQAGRPMEQIKQQLLEEELKKFFRPEFLNRFDAIVVFKPLDFDQVVAIAHLELRKVATMLGRKGITLEASDAAIEDLAKRGFDPKFGARPLRRLVQDQVDNALADYLLRGQLGRRDVAILEPGGKIRVEKAPQL
jgi:ATP-dependent Clp protease ATP-binding subunit ClpC